MLEQPRFLVSRQGYHSKQSVFCSSIPFYLRTLSFLLLLPPYKYLRRGVTNQALTAPPPTKARAYFFIVRRLQHFLPSSTGAELCLAVGSYTASAVTVHSERS